MLSGLEKKHVRGFNLLLMIILGVSLGYLFSSAAGLYLSWQVVPTDKPSSQENANTSQPTLQTYLPITENNIFDPEGRSEPGSGSPRDGMQKTQETSTQRADMTLLGIVTSSNRPFAVIQTEGNAQIFHLDEEVSGGGKLEGISREEIRVRDQDGTLYTLTLPKTAVAAPAPSTSVPSFEGIKEVGKNRWVISSQEAQKARGNIGEILKQARFEPRMNNGQVEGFRIKMVRPRTLLWKLGLKRGDIIMEINDVQLDNAEKALQIFQQLKEARNISIALRRRGKNLTFEYAVE